MAPFSQLTVPSPRPGRGAPAPSARRRARRGASPRAVWARSIAPACGPGRRRQGHQRVRVAWTPTSCDHVGHGAGQPTPLRGRWPARRPSAPSTTATGRTPGAPRRPPPGAWAPPSGARGEGLVKRPGHLKSFTRRSFAPLAAPFSGPSTTPTQLLDASAAPWRRCTAAPPPRRPAPRAAPRSAREGSRRSALLGSHGPLVGHQNSGSVASQQRLGCTGRLARARCAGCSAPTGVLSLRPRAPPRLSDLSGALVRSTPF